MDRFIDDDGVVSGPFLRTPYNYDMDDVSAKTGLVCLEGPFGRTQQSSKEECDINTIVRNFGLTGELPQNVRMPESGDFVDAVTDYQTALNMVMEAEARFMEFPAEVRKRFNHDPGKLMEFVEDPNNLDEARKLGLAVPAKVAPEPMAVRVVPEAPGNSST